MRGGHNKKNNSLKVLHGMARKNDDRSPKPIPKFPHRAPRGFPKYGKQLWDKYAPKLEELGVLRETDAPAWETLCLTYQMMKDAEREIIDHGLIVSGARGAGEKVKNPAVSILNAARQQFRLQCQNFGLDPQSRDRLNIQISDEDDPMERLLSGVRERH